MHSQSDESKEGFIVSSKYTVLIVTNMYNSASAELMIEVKIASVHIEPLHNLLNLLGRKKSPIRGEPSQVVTSYSALALVQEVV